MIKNSIISSRSSIINRNSSISRFWTNSGTRVSSRWSSMLSKLKLERSTMSSSSSLTVSLGKISVWELTDYEGECWPSNVPPGPGQTHCPGRGWQRLLQAGRWHGLQVDLSTERLHQGRLWGLTVLLHPGEISRLYSNSWYWHSHAIIVNNYLQYPGLFHRESLTEVSGHPSRHGYYQRYYHQPQQDLS